MANNDILPEILDVGSTNVTGVSSGVMPGFQYTASSLDLGNDAYNVDGLSYPQDLMGNDNQYGENRVVFYINVSTDSRVLKGGVQEVNIPGGVKRDMRSQLLGQNITVGQAMTAATVPGAILGAGAGAAAGIKSNGLLSAKAIGGGIAGAIVGGAPGFIGSAIIANQTGEQTVQGQPEAPTFSRPQKRLKSAIALYIPNQLNARYSVGWESEDTFGFSAATKAASLGADEIARGLKGEGGARGLVGEVLAAMAVNSDKVPFGKEQGITAGLAQNPKKEQAFKNVDFRTFTFEYQFAPRSETEAQHVLNIIRAFKYHMHPEFKSQDAFLYIYPSEFDIVYYKGNKENLNIHRHTSCVLTELNVNYTPNGVFTTFPNGMPTQISITMTFKELMLLSKETIEKYT